MASTRDTWVQRSLLAYGEWSELEVDVFRRVLAEGDRVVDAGANVGAFTVPLARLVGRAGRVFAFEAQRRLHRILGANVVLNDLRNVQSPHLALGGPDDPSTVRVPNVNYSVPANFGGVSLVDKIYPPGTTHPVDLTTLDAWLTHNWLMQDGEHTFEESMCPRLLKLDVEGMEGAILRGAAATLRRCRPVVYAENNWYVLSAVSSLSHCIRNLPVSPPSRVSLSSHFFHPTTSQCAGQPGRPPAAGRGTRVRGRLGRRAIL